MLTGLVLKDRAHLRIFRLANSQCIHELWTQLDGAWSLANRTTLARNGAPLPFIPFVFHGPSNSRPDPDRLPLRDIISANLSHYRLDADYKHGLHFTALPTAWVSGMDKDPAPRIGSNTAWISDLPGASAGFLEFKGSGLGHIERAMERIERHMSLLGARMLEAPPPDPSGPSTINHQPSTNLSGLGSIVGALNESLSRVLQVAQWWVVGGELDALVGQVGFTMNTDLGARALTAEEINAVVTAWKAGAISRETMLEHLKRGEVLPDGRSVAQERALIHGKLRGES